MQAGKSGHRELDEMGREYLQKQRGGGGELKRVMERLVSQKEGEQDKLGGKVSGPEGVSSGVQPLAGEGRGGGRGGSVGQQQYGECVD